MELLLQPQGCGVGVGQADDGKLAHYFHRRPGALLRFLLHPVIVFDHKFYQLCEIVDVGLTGIVRAHFQTCAVAGAILHWDSIKRVFKMVVINPAVILFFQKCFDVFLDEGRERGG